MAGLPEKWHLDVLALNDVIAALVAFMLPIIKAANANAVFSARWQAGGPWSLADAG